MIPPVILPPVACDGLSTKVGVWENISPEQLRNPRNEETLTVVVNPKDGTVYATGSNQTNGGACPECAVNKTGVLRSSNCGASFERVNNDLGDSANLNTGSLWALLMHPTEPQVLFTVNGYGNDPSIYKSLDAGVNWKKLDAGVGFVQSMSINANDGNHLAVTFHDDCKAPLTPWCFSKTNDGGNSWTMFNGPTSVPGFTIGGWSEAASINILGKDAYLIVSANGLWYTGDTGATWKQVAAETVYGAYPGSKTIANGTLLVPGANHILMSPAAPDKDPPFALAGGASLEPIPNSPGVSSMITVGNLVIAGTGRDEKRPLWTTTADDPTTWTQVTEEICSTTSTVCRGPNQFAYDPIHKVIYAANWGAGLWRYVVE